MRCFNEDLLEQTEQTAPKRRKHAETPVAVELLISLALAALSLVIITARLVDKRFLAVAEDVKRRSTRKLMGKRTARGRTLRLLADWRVMGLRNADLEAKNVCPMFCHTHTTTKQKKREQRTPRHVFGAYIEVQLVHLQHAPVLATCSHSV